ncbi:MULTISPECIES: LysR family transcriptional regulator [Pseudomonas]|jgi:DNA-binding transcriptional LysR family regulator|uniref:LysR family transcriptional regulator n=1 Tax=Pseudomonas TaxID=286 RepID=UPI000480DCE2|nr:MULTISPECIES: LysR family transcriptional regulator [Pseudomonas]KAA8554265.1 HTH-type transcriptional regulator BenM [Pseudomonas marginalis]PUB47851.1 DNA-binding transcriptional LysR family regulator [Pseudomonas sp. GV047]TWR72802.1 LysR family transcriptional regulator [Pseudomonas marginalis]SCX23813.1 DNA-binding transcriptional regulator, LysR family [Pseudomonas sp. NFACC25]SME90301.1 DNA-binding transcriptional regulator, LysR family [Pseudomonas sp. LAMO17WK12:I1]
MINFRLIRHLWLFLAVAEEQNFGRAAKRLGMSQPPLSEQIQVLEQALKVTLFERSRRGAKLTPVGAAILPAVRKFAEQLERLELAVEEAVAGQSGMLTIGAISTAMFDVLPGLIDLLKQRYPQLTVSVREIDSVEAVPALEAGDIDLAFARLDGDLGPAIQSLPLREDRLMVALPGDHPLASRTRISLSSLASEPLVMFSRKVSPVYFDNLIATCRASGFSPRVLHEVRSVASQIAFVSCGQGIALVPASLKKLAPDNVVLRALTQKLNVVTTAVAWNSQRPNPLVTELVAQFQAHTIGV